MISENSSQLRQRQEGGLVYPKIGQQGCKSRVGGRKHREGAIALERIHQIGLTNCQFQDVVVVTCCNDVHHRLAPSGNRERHGSGNECKELFHKNGFGFDGGTPH